MTVFYVFKGPNWSGAHVAPGALDFTRAFTKGPSNYYVPSVLY